MKDLRVLENLALPDVVPLCIPEACLQVVLNVIKRRVCEVVQLSLDVIESNWFLDLNVIIGVLPFGRQTQEVDRERSPPDDCTCPEA